MGIVYEGFGSQLQRFAALKFLSPDLSTRQEAKQRLVQIARSASALDRLQAHGMGGV
jgi:hypothetical protein